MNHHSFRVSSERVGVSVHLYTDPCADVCVRAYIRASCIHASAATTPGWWTTSSFYLSRIGLHDRHLISPSLGHSGIPLIYFPAPPRARAPFFPSVRPSVRVPALTSHVLSRRDIEAREHRVATSHAGHHHHLSLKFQCSGMTALIIEFL